MSSQKLKRNAEIVLVLLLVLLPIWFYYLAPQLTKIEDDFQYKGIIFSQDNFYDSNKSIFSGEMISDTEHYYEVIDKQDGILIIKNVFKVREFSGEEIFSVERKYGINPLTRKHVPGYGDKDREGYLFAPPGLKKNQNFTYWHVNYDIPVQMLFEGEEVIAGLTVYRYESNFHADQTFDLGRIKNLGKRGIDLEVNLQLWVEPYTGRKIKYEDSTIAYFYDLNTKERIEPWNKFHNVFDEVSVLKQVEITKAKKFFKFLINRVITMILVSAAGALLIYLLLDRKRRD